MSRFLYNLLLPFGLLAMLPAALKKNRLRGGSWSDVWQRLGWLSDAQRASLAALSHFDHRYWFHAVSVGEVGVALKLINHLLARVPQSAILLTTTTPTAHRIASSFASRHPGRLAVLFSPLDLPTVVSHLLDELAPRQIVLVEAEVWPNWMHEAKKRRIPVSLVNARLSERSERRFHRLAFLTQPLFAKLDLVLVQEPEDITRWARLGANPRGIHLTGSVKYDPEGQSPPTAQILQLASLLPSLGIHRNQAFPHQPVPRVLLAASTHAGEEIALAQVWRKLCLACPATPIALWIVPRHVERAPQIVAELLEVGLRPRLRSTLSPSSPAQAFDSDAPLIIDTTGELNAWQHLSDWIVIGKSFLAEGGQNPAEAALARKPVIFGPHMQNFEPLVKLLLEVGGALQVPSLEHLSQALEKLVCDPSLASRMGEAGFSALTRHTGATRRSIDHLLAVPA